MGVLRCCHDKLQDSEKLMFLDITCLFYELSAKEALAYWTSCRNCNSCGGVKMQYTSLKNLIDKSIIHHIYGELFDMHDLLRNLSLQIDRKGKSHFIYDNMDNGIFTMNQVSSFIANFMRFIFLDFKDLTLQIQMIHFLIKEICCLTCKKVLIVLFRY